jgi:hypothetical protein
LHEHWQKHSNLTLDLSAKFTFGDLGAFGGNPFCGNSLRYRPDLGPISACSRRCRGRPRRGKRDRAGIGPRSGRYRHEFPKNGFPQNAPKPPIPPTTQGRGPLCHSEVSAVTNGSTDFGLLVFVGGGRNLGRRRPDRRYGRRCRDCGLVPNSVELSHSLKVSDRRRTTPKSVHNRSEALCAGLWVPSRVFGAGLAQL